MISEKPGVGGHPATALIHLADNIGHSRDRLLKAF